MLWRWRVYLPESLFCQPLLNDCWVFFTKLSQLLESFLPIPQVTRLVVNTLELIQFGNILDNIQERSCMS